MEQSIEYKAIECKNDLIDAWFNENDKDFENIIRITSQRVARLKRDLLSSENYDKSSFFIGFQAGCEQILTELFRERLRQERIKESVANAGSEAVKILLYLKEHNYQRHPEMAENLDMTYNDLTQIMKHLIFADAVSASRTGPNTRYSLTPAGERFCRELQ